MLKIHHLTLGDSRTNCYILHEDASTSCCIIDPGDCPDTILQFLAQEGLKAEAILLTHGHFDHVGGVEPIRRAFGCVLWMAQEDIDYPLAYQPLFPLVGYTGDICFYTDGQILDVAGLELHVLHTPGHSAGSVCLICQDAMFSGDTLFAAVCGRTDIPGSDPAAMQRSLKRLARLSGHYALYPGHGRSSTLEEEQRHNPYLQGFSEDGV